MEALANCLFDVLTRYVSSECLMEACCGAVVALRGGGGQLCSLMALRESVYPKMFAAAYEHGYGGGLSACGALSFPKRIVHLVYIFCFSF